MADNPPAPRAQKDPKINGLAQSQPNQPLSAVERGALRRAEERGAGTWWGSPAPPWPSAPPAPPGPAPGRSRAAPCRRTSATSARPCAYLRSGAMPGDLPRSSADTCRLLPAPAPLPAAPPRPPGPDPLGPEPPLSIHRHRSRERQRAAWRLLASCRRSLLSSPALDAKRMKSRDFFSDKPLFKRGCGVSLK